MFLVMVFRSGGRSEGIMMGSPFFFAGELAADLCGPRNNEEHLAAAAVWIFIYGIAAVAFPIATLCTFNRCLGRVEVGIRPSREKTPVRLAPVRVKPSVAETLDPA